MGCFPSLLRSRLPADPALIEGQIPSKPFDSDSHSCKSVSSPMSSIELKSPIISIEPPSPFESPPDGFADIIEVEKEPLDLPIDEINNKIAALTASIQGHESETAERSQRTISDLNAILDIISENSLVYTKLEILRSHLNSLYREKERIESEHFHPATTNFPSLWKEFVELDEEEQRNMARKQSPSSAIMQMFTILSNLRRACDMQRDFDLRIERKVGSQFEDILGDLKDIRAQDAALKWRVFGIVTGKRKEEGERRVDEILGFRMRVSGLLVGVVEALREVDDD